MARVQDDYATSMTVTTSEYLEAVRSCVSHLPAAVLRYDTDSFQEHVAEVSDRESRADEYLGDLRRVCGRVGPDYSDVYLRRDDVMELYGRIDAVPNAAESFVRELAATRPTLDAATTDDLAELAALATRITRVLTELVDNFVATLCSQGPSLNPTNDIDTVADLESRGDALTYRIVERAFADGASADALLVRDVAASLDETLDAAEDVADHLLFMHGDVR